MSSKHNFNQSKCEKMDRKVMEKEVLMVRTWKFKSRNDCRSIKLKPETKVHLKKT